MDPLEAHLHRQIEHSRDFFWHRVRWKAVAGELTGDRFVLTDVGAGIGLIGDYLADERPAVTYRFVEPIEFLVRELESRFGAAANANDAADYAGSEYITLLDVLEHQADDRAFLAELVAKMDPGAKLVLTVPALQRLWSQWDVALGHFKRYEKATLRAAFAGLPVRVLETSYLFPRCSRPRCCAGAAVPWTGRPPTPAPRSSPTCPVRSTGACTRSAAPRSASAAAGRRARRCSRWSSGRERASRTLGAAS